MKYDRSLSISAFLPRGLSGPSATAAVLASALLMSLASPMRMPLEPVLATPQSLTVVALSLLLSGACLCTTTIAASNAIEGKQL